MSNNIMMQQRGHQQSQYDVMRTPVFSILADLRNWVPRNLFDAQNIFLSACSAFWEETCINTCSYFHLPIPTPVAQV